MAEDFSTFGTKQIQTVTSFLALFIVLIPCDIFTHDSHFVYFIFEFLASYAVLAPIRISAVVTRFSIVKSLAVLTFPFRYNRLPVHAQPGRIKGRDMGLNVIVRYGRGRWHW